MIRITQLGGVLREVLTDGCLRSCGKDGLINLLLNWSFEGDYNTQQEDNLFYGFFFRTTQRILVLFRL